MGSPATAITARPTARRLRLAGLMLPAAFLIGLWLYATPGGLLGKADAVGYAVCHRLEARSFHLGDRPLPLCARCTGMFLGAMLTFSFYTALGRGRASSFPKLPLLLTLGVFGLAFAVDGLNSYLSLFPTEPNVYQPTNVLRLITGTLAGIALGSLVYPGFNQAAWRDWSPGPALRSFRELALLVALAGVAVAAVLTENPLLLYPLALLSTLGVLVLLTTVYSMILLIVFRRENQATSWGQLTGMLAVGLTLAIGQIALIDLVRYLVTGTWAGFSLLV